MRVIGVVGAGVIGIGVIHLLAMYGYDVIAIDETNEKLINAKQRLIKSARMLRLLSKENPDHETILKNITWDIDIQRLRSCDFIIENIKEDFFAKEKLYRQINTIINNTTCIGVNTSCIPITKIAALVQNPSRVIGIHFMNPVPIKSTIELVRANNTSEHTVQTTMNLLGSMDKKCIIVNDSPGFVINRILMLTINQAIQVLEEDVANAQSIDELFIGCLGHKMGPLATADLIGLDTIYHSLIVLQNEFHDERYKPSLLLEKMLEKNWLGQKTGQGFFLYT